MTAKTGRPYPNPRPKKAISRRLEDVRVEFGYQSKRAFWKKLLDGWAHPVSYEAVRNYHYNREPPASYLARVAEVFSEVCLEWLVTGDGEMLKSDQARRRDPHRELLERIRQQHPVLKGLPVGDQEAFLDLVLGLQYQTPGGIYLGEVEHGEEQQLRIASDLVFLLTLPLRAWGFQRPDVMREEARQEMGFLVLDRGSGEVELALSGSPDLPSYVHQMLGALRIMLKSPRRGDKLKDRPASLVPTLRRFLEGDNPEPSDEEIEAARAVQQALGERLEEESHRARQAEYVPPDLFGRPTGEEADVEP